MWLWSPLKCQDRLKMLSVGVETDPAALDTFQKLEEMANLTS